MVLRFSPGTISSQILRRAASFQKSVSKLSSMGSPALRCSRWAGHPVYPKICRERKGARKHPRHCRHALWQGLARRCVGSDGARLVDGEDLDADARHAVLLHAEFLRCGAGEVDDATAGVGPAIVD